MALQFGTTIEGQGDHDQNELVKAIFALQGKNAEIEHGVNMARIEAQYCLKMIARAGGIAHLGEGLPQIQMAIRAPRVQRERAPQVSNRLLMFLLVEQRYAEPHRNRRRRTGEGCGAA